MEPLFPDRLRAGTSKKIQQLGINKGIKWLLRSLKNRRIFDPILCRSTLGSHHINSIQLIENELFVTAFGPKEGALKSSATKGYLFGFKNKHKIINGVYHPHSLVCKEDAFYYCESATRKVKKGNEDILQLNSGYTRGLALTNSFLIVGSSSARIRSRSTGLVNNIADPGDLDLTCKVSIFEGGSDLQNQLLLKEFDFLPAHKEIYDILILD